MQRVDKITAIAMILAVALDAAIWQSVAFETEDSHPVFRFLDVGQGDATLLELPGRVQILADAGPDRSIIPALEEALGGRDRRIELAIVTHPELDHFNGFNFILDHYDIGAVILNGRPAEGAVGAWNAFLEKIREKKIPVVRVGAGDRIVYGDTEIRIISPGPEILGSGAINDTSIVGLVRTPRIRVLLTGDIGSSIERFLLESGADVRADVLKVPHHGSKYSSSPEFLRSVNPKVAIIEVGATNRYGHPAPEALERISASTAARVFRTDRDGSVKISVSDGQLRVFTSKSGPGR
ncbi:MBL fold metallo-hydrolase [Candidatus Parcubacteria bacterium]|nr:MAG: MBL fold metallo-hydrolase [Candidatus Parcubacteria bacterium]